MKQFKEIINSKTINISEIESHRLIQLQELRKRNLIGLSIWVLLTTIGVLLSVVVYNGWVLIVTIVFGFIAFLSLRGGIRRKLHDSIKEQIVKKLIENISPDFEYFPKKHMTQNVFKTSQFIKHYSSFTGEDLFVGIYNNIYAEFSELTITQKSDKSTTTVFKGPFYSIQTFSSFKGRTTVVPDYAEKLLGKFGRAIQKMNFSRDSLIKIDNAAFEKQFAVFSSDENEAKTILSPELISFLVRERKRVKQVFFGFSENQIFFGIYNSKDLFRINVKNEIKEETVRFYYDELVQNLDLIEELFRLVTKAK